MGIFWDGVEPEPGSYDEAYLDRVERVVQKAEELGIYIFLDMHQDLFGAKYGDGAPDWATLDEGCFHPEDCTIWYEAYLTSEAIARAADNFWANNKAPDGIGLLDHYENMWEHLAKRFHGYSNIMGFEPMNEPFMGSLAPQTFGMAFAKIAEINPNFNHSQMQSLTNEEREIMDEVFNEHFMKFDKETLMPFYNRILRAVRKVCDIPIVTGGNIYSSSFVKTGIEHLVDPEGNVDMQQIYAPHGYDAVVDSENYDAFSRENVYRIFALKRRSQIDLQRPVIIGEWGAFPSSPFTNTLIEHMTGILEAYLWSSTYWVYRPGMEYDSNFSRLERGYPAKVTGKLLFYHYEYQTKTLTARWEARKNGKTILYMPDLSKMFSENIILSGIATYELKKMEHALGGYVVITTHEDGIMDVSIRS